MQKSKRIWPVEFVPKKILEETEKTGNHMEKNSENQQTFLSVSYRSQSSTREVPGFPAVLAGKDREHESKRRIDSDNIGGKEKSEIQSRTDTENRQISSCNLAAVPSETDSEETDMEIDTEGGEEVGRIDAPVTRLKYSA